MSVPSARLSYVGKREQQRGRRQKLDMCPTDQLDFIPASAANPEPGRSLVLAPDWKPREPHEIRNIGDNLPTFADSPFSFALKSVAPQRS